MRKFPVSDGTKYSFHGPLIDVSINRSGFRCPEGKRGFVITIDAIAALSFMLLSMYFIQSTSFNPIMLKGTQLKQLSLDAFSILENTGRLSEVVDGNSTAAREIFLYTPEAVCMQLSIAASNGTVLATIDKPGCGGIGSEVQIVYGVFRYGGELHTSTLRSWYKQEGLE